MGVEIKRQTIAGMVGVVASPFIDYATLARGGDSGGGHSSSLVVGAAAKMDALPICYPLTQ